jgi:3',5'-cyclic AMP phosphodiesterase CpdA
MNGSASGHDRQSAAHHGGKPILDPRLGDMEDDYSATKQRSLLAIVGSLLVEISLTKLLFVWAVSMLLPSVLLGLAPILLTAWISETSDWLTEATGTGVVIVLLGALAVALIGWRPLFRLAENNFWSLNALAIQPAYAGSREALRHLTERALADPTGSELARLRAISCAAAGVLLFVVAGLVGISVWPATHWAGSVADIAAPHRLVLPTVTNAIVIMSTYLAVASLVWGFVDASSDQPIDFRAFDNTPAGERVWRVAHLSDVHVVGERYGFRIESGRAGARGNERFERVMERLATIHAVQALDLILLSGDMTDAGTSAEWAEFLDVLARHPDLAERMLILPGNHDVNIVDRANPARFDLPFSAAKTLRKLRVLSAIALIAKDRLLLASFAGKTPGPALAAVLEPRRSAIMDFADAGGFRASAELFRLWEELFPLVLPPAEEDGLGIALLNSNADTNFSFTNALGMISMGQAKRLTAAFDAYPKARWIVALHHHLTEYPMLVKAFSERIGTKLINGSWFLRVLKPYAERVVVMHGHRHIDWIGACGHLKIVSAPSPVMGHPAGPPHFYVHMISAGSDGSLRLLKPERVDIEAAREGWQPGRAGTAPPR